jgi:hypothetical protein
MTLRFCCINFWENAFDGDFYEYLLKRSLKCRFNWVDSVNDADIVFTSVFGSQYSDPCKTILISAEHQSPQLSRCSYSLSFDTDDWLGRNCYCPYWYNRLKWPDFNKKPHPIEISSHTSFEPQISIDSLLSTRKLDFELEDKQFCALVAGNPDPLRINLFNLLSTYKEVAGYGNLFGNPWRKPKHYLLNKFKFCLCPENCLSPGYITEKIFDAWSCSTIPIYYGPSDLQSFNINPNAIINYHDFDSALNFLDFIRHIDSSEVTYKSIYEEPLLLSRPSLEEQIIFIKKSISSIVGASV